MILNYINWNPNPEIINILGLSIRYYGVLFATGLIIAISVLKWIFNRENIPLKNLDKLTIYGMIGILAGARLGHCLFYEPAYYLSHPIEMILPINFSPSGGIQFTGYQGLASHGGILGLYLTLYFYSRKTKHAMINVIDLIAVVIGISLGFIRLANFMNSEIIGIPTTNSWGVIFERVDHIPRHPAQLYEAICYFIIFTVMITLYIKIGKRLKNGFFFGLGSILFCTARILIEFIKENQVGFEDGMKFNMGQLLSLPFIVIGIGFIIYSFWRTEK
jgi:phosphatidylglycerol:prolipoprotein diacylglycerol transferase